MVIIFGGGVGRGNRQERHVAAHLSYSAKRLTQGIAGTQGKGRERPRNKSCRESVLRILTSVQAAEQLLESSLKNGSWENYFFFFFFKMMWENARHAQVKWSDNYFLTENKIKK